MVGPNVRIGSARVGQVSRVTSITLPDRLPAARVELSFDPSVKHLPVDTVVRVCPRSAHRAAYLQLTPGSSMRVFPDGGTIPLSQVGAQPRC
jgi:ABC-type transporter Mla subunit MlaD